MRGIEPNAPLEAIADVVRALAPVLAYPVTKVRKIIKREIIFYEEAVMPIPQENSVEETPRIIISPVPGRTAAGEAAGRGKRFRYAAILPSCSHFTAHYAKCGLLPLIAEPLSIQIVLFAGRPPPGDRMKK